MSFHDLALLEFRRQGENLLTYRAICSGPYSAGAISSIAFGKRSALVDGNVTRVLSRLTALHAPSAAKSTTSFIWSLADCLVPDNVEVDQGEGADKIKNRPGSWNQGLMELGATVCTPKNPKCGECPISEECLGYQEVSLFAAICREELMRWLIITQNLETVSFHRSSIQNQTEASYIGVSRDRCRRSLHTLLSSTFGF